MWATDYLCRRGARHALRASVLLSALGMQQVSAQSSLQPLRPSPSIRAASTPLSNGMPAITDADVARASQQQPQLTDTDVAQAARRFRAPTDEELARVPLPGHVNVDALPTPTPALPGAAGAINFADVARGYEAMQNANHAAALNGSRDAALPSLVVFISFSMPGPTLERLVSQAQTVGATLVLRGLISGSLRETAQRCQALIGQQHVAVQIDPQAFERFAVSQTPTFVLVKPGHALAASPILRGAASESKDGATAASCAGAKCTDAAGFASVRGDVSIDYALRVIASRDPAFETDARVLLRRLSGGLP